MVEECSLPREASAGFSRVVLEEASPLMREGGRERKKQLLKLWKSSPSLFLRGNIGFPLGHECARHVVMLKALYFVSAKKLRDLGAGQGYRLPQFPLYALSCPQ